MTDKNETTTTTETAETTETNDAKQVLKMSDSVYNVLKLIVQTVLPALATLVAGVASVYMFPGATQAVAIIGLVTTFLGTILGISSRSYANTKADGNLVIDHSSTEKPAYLQLDSEAASVANKDQVTLNVVNHDNSI